MQMHENITARSWLTAQLHRVASSLVLALCVVWSSAASTRVSENITSPAIASDLRSMDSVGVPPGGPTHEQVYNVIRQEQPTGHEGQGAYRAPNPTQGFIARFHHKGVRVEQAAKDSTAWVFGMELMALGRIGSLAAVPDPTVSVAANRVEYRRGGLVEWYENRPDGLEQGFTLATPPVGRGEVGIELMLVGDLAARLVTDGSLEAMVQGEPRLRYGKLSVFDAKGRVLSSRMELDGQRLTIAFADTGAEYPVTVDPLIQTPSWVATGTSRFEEFGRAVAAGDVNGDGYSDVIVSSPGQFSSSPGKVSVYLGSVDGLGSSPEWTAEGPKAEAFGFAVGAADVNGDGYSDIIIGSPSFATPCTAIGINLGRVYIWFGGPSSVGNESGLGPVGTPANADIVLSPPLVNSFCGGGGGGFGTVVGSAGDINGDQFEDIFVGNPGRFLETFFPDTQPGFGEVDVYLGSRAGMTLDRRLRADVPEICLPAEFGGDGPENCSNVGFGTAIAAGDVNGDGRSDLVVAAPSLNGRREHRKLYVFPGTTTGIDDEPVLGLIDMAAQTVAVANINRDCCADILLTTQYTTFGSSPTLLPGGLFVFHGTPDGVQSAPNESYTPYQVSFYLEPRFGGSLKSVFIEAVNTVASAGDVNSDGFGDIVLSTVLPFGVPRCDEFVVSDVLLGCDPTFGIRGGDAFSDPTVPQPTTERVYVLHGGPDGLVVPPASILDRPSTFSCPSPAHPYCFGSTMAHAGDINGDTFDDVVIGGWNLTPRDARGFEIPALERAGAGFTFVGFGIRLNPIGLDFGELKLSATSDERTSVVFNGGRPTTIITSSVGANVGDFLIDMSDCNEKHLDPGGSCTIRARFVPQHAGKANARINITTDTGESLFLDLSGTGKPPDPPTAAPTRTDHEFVLDENSHLDRCFFRNEGPIQFDISITRSVTNRDPGGPGISALNPDGTIKSDFLQLMLSNSVLSSQAILKLTVYNDTRLASPGVGSHRIFFNGQEIGTVSATDIGAWKSVSLSVPIELVRFPERAAVGSGPNPRLNTVQMDIDATNANEVWCAAIGWGSLSFKAMSPVVMVHGNGSNPAFWERQGFKGFLDQHMIPNDNSIMMNPDEGPIVANARQINNQLPGIVRSFGADSVHLVAHSKGGLDTREWLATYYNDFRENRRCGAQLGSKCTVLTLSTLSTPHRGSAGADLLIAWEHAIWVTGTSLGADIIALKLGSNPGTHFLTTYYVSETFNPSNVPLLPVDVVYRAVGADLDTDSDGHAYGAHFGYIYFDIEDVPEWGKLTLESPELADPGLPAEVLLGGSAGIVDTTYHFFKETHRVELKQASLTLCFPLAGCHQVKTWYYGQAVGKGGPNDMAVTLQSASGPPGGPFSVLPSLKRNHADIANDGVAAMLLPYLQETERSRGDFQ